MKSLGSQLPDILKKQSGCLRDLNAKLLAVLPAEYHDHVQVAALHRGILSLAADSPVWATKIRYLSNEITRQLSRKTGLTIKSVTIIIQSYIPKSLARNRSPLHISRRSARQIETLAKTTRHPALKQALTRLVKRAK